MPDFDGVLAGKGVDITVLTGPAVTTHHERLDYSDYRIDETTFSCFLDEWLAGDGHLGPC